MSNEISHRFGSLTVEEMAGLSNNDIAMICRLRALYVGIPDDRRRHDGPQFASLRAVATKLAAVYGGSPERYRYHLLAMRDAGRLTFADSSVSLSIGPSSGCQTTSAVVGTPPVLVGTPPEMVATPPLSGGHTTSAGGHTTTRRSKKPWLTRDDEGQKNSLVVLSSFQEGVSTSQQQPAAAAEVSAAEIKTPAEERPNEFSGRCPECHILVPAGEGTFVLGPTGKYRSIHLECKNPPPPPPPPTEEEQQQLEVERLQQKLKTQQYLLERQQEADRKAAQQQAVAPLVEMFRDMWVRPFKRHPWGRCWLEEATSYRLSDPDDLTEYLITSCGDDHDKAEHRIMEYFEHLSGGGSYYDSVSAAKNFERFCQFCSDAKRS